MTVTCCEKLLRVNTYVTIRNYSGVVTIREFFVCFLCQQDGLIIKFLPYYHVRVDIFLIASAKNLNFSLFPSVFVSIG